MYLYGRGGIIRPLPITKTGVIYFMERLLTVREVAQYMSVDLQTVYGWIRQGRLEAVKPSKRMVRIRQSTLEDFVRGGE